MQPIPALRRLGAGAGGALTGWYNGQAASGPVELPVRLPGAFCRGDDKMYITLDIDAEIIAKISRIADAQDTTVTAIVSEYLVALANHDGANDRNGAAAGNRLERIARLRETADRSDRQAAARTWTRDDLYDRPYRHYYGQ